MDTQTLGAAIAIGKRIAGSILPSTTSADAGKVLTVGPDGKWVGGAVTGMVISASGHTLNITNE